MQVVHHSPVARGVNQLMYVGDVETSGFSLSSLPVKLALGAAVVWFFFLRKR